MFFDCSKAMAMPRRQFNPFLMQADIQLVSHWLQQSLCPYADLQLFICYNSLVLHQWDVTPLNQWRSGNGRDRANARKKIEGRGRSRP
jgi:hypothetical protein